MMLTWNMKNIYIFRKVYRLKRKLKWLEKCEGIAEFIIQM